MIKIWTGNQMDLLKEQNQLLGDGKIPDEVITAARNTIQILDDSYGIDRNPDSDLGGYVSIFDTDFIGKCEDYQYLLDKYGVSADMAEFTEPITTQKSYREKINYQWYLQVFIVSSDYAICVIYKDIV